MIDSHCHINLKHFDGDLEGVITRALGDGVRALMNIGYDPETARATIGLVERFPFVFGVVGIHPHDAQRLDDAYENEIREMLDHERILGIGEVGLDYYRDLSPRDVQADAFRRMIHLAREKSTPLVIHCRDAFDDAVRILEEEGAPYRGIFHAFGGNAEQARRVIDLGFHVGIGGVLTYRNSGLDETLSAIGLDRVVLETDSPYLTPHPWRGNRNEPAYVARVLQRIGQIQQMDPADVSNVTDENFCRAMGIAPSMLPPGVYRVDNTAYVHTSVLLGLRETPASESISRAVHTGETAPESSGERTEPVTVADEFSREATEPTPLFPPGESGQQPFASTREDAFESAPDDSTHAQREAETGGTPPHRSETDARANSQPNAQVGDGATVHAGMESLLDSMGDGVEELILCGLSDPLDDPAYALALCEAAHRRGWWVRINTDGRANQTAGRDISDELAAVVNEIVVKFYGTSAVQHDRMAPVRRGEQGFEILRDFVRCTARTRMETVCEFIAAPKFNPQACRTMARELGAQYDIRMYRS